MHCLTLKGPPTLLHLERLVNLEPKICLKCLISCPMDYSSHGLVLLVSTGKKMSLEIANALAECKNISSIKDLSGKSTIRQLIEGIRRCDAVISQETGSLHIAVALKKPTVGIMGGGHYGRFYPWGDEKINRVANKPMDCYWCNWKCKYTTMRCIQEIQPEIIAKELVAALHEAGVI